MRLRAVVTVSEMYLDNLWVRGKINEYHVVLTRSSLYEEYECQSIAP